MQFYKSYYLLVLLFGHKLSFTKAAINMNSKELDMHDWQLQISDRLACTYSCVYVLSCVFLFFFFFLVQPTIVDFVNYEQCICALFTVPQIILFINFFIKNGSHSTIYTFKNYFATVFLVSVFSFSKNKLNPNTP